MIRCFIVHIIIQLGYMTRGRIKKRMSAASISSFLNNSFYLLIAAFLFIVIIKIILSLKFYSPFILNDELYYDSLAKNVLNGKLVPIIGDTRSPGYPIVLSVAYLLSGDKGTIYHIMLADQRLDFHINHLSLIFHIKKILYREVIAIRGY